MEKIEKYKLLNEQIKSLTQGETDEVAKMANIAAVIHETMGFWWTGFYRVKNNELILGPFQGPVACMHIGYGKGVCGSSWKQGETIVVPDVELFPGRNEAGEITAVLDIDSKELATFDDIDKEWLEEIVKVMK